MRQWLQGELDDASESMTHASTVMMRQSSLHTPLGEITLFASGDALIALEWGRGGGADLQTGDDPLLEEAKRQLNAYFDGRLEAFDLPQQAIGTEFQNRVWAYLTGIPVGVTHTYGQVAAAMGTSARAAGQAIACNPLPILIPCHRVTAAAGKLGGYSGGDGGQTKLWLLSHETRIRLGSIRPLDEEHSA